MHQGFLEMEQIDGREVGDFESRRFRRTRMHWMVPKHYWLKMNFNRASKGNLEESSFEAILRNESRGLVSMIMGFMGISSNNEFELKALDKGLEMCLERGVSKVLIEGDS
ncbi:hypothetical protein SUGI_0435600 [Cryptomeria japonica]|nr:hypothetical protein SUGI_0435600 [Cryptomeria japonica]